MQLLMRTWRVVRTIPMLVACLMTGSGTGLMALHAILRSVFAFQPEQSPLTEMGGVSMFLAVFAITPWLVGISINFPTWTTAQWLKWEWSKWDLNTRLMAVCGVCQLAFGLTVGADILLP